MKILSLVLGLETAVAAFAQKPPVPVQQRFADPLPAPPREPFKAGKFEIRPNEVIVFTGGTNMVRLAESGQFEAVLTTLRLANRMTSGSEVVAGPVQISSWKLQQA